MANTLYDAIGVHPDATAEQIEAACLRLGEQYKAQGNVPGANEKFAEVERAYEMLADPVCRAAYDRSIDTPHGWKSIVAKYGWSGRANWKWLGIAGLSLVALFWLGNFYLASAARQELEARGIAFTPDDFTNEAGKRAEVVKLFLGAGMAPYVLDHRGNNPIVAAARALNLESIRLLVDAGARVNVESSDGTPLSAALAATSENYSRVFLGLSTNISDISDTAAFLKTVGEREAIEREVNLRVAMPVVQFLLDRGADPSAKSVRDNIFIYKLGFENTRSGEYAVYQLVTNALEKRNQLTH